MKVGDNIQIQTPHSSQGFSQYVGEIIATVPYLSVKINFKGQERIIDFSDNGFAIDEPDFWEITFK